MEVSKYARFVAFLATAARQRRILMGELLVMMPAYGIFLRRRLPEHPPDLDVAGFYLAKWMIEAWGMSNTEAYSRTHRLCQELLDHKRELPTLEAFGGDPDELATRISFLAALCHRDWPTFSQLRILFPRRGPHLVTEQGVDISPSLDLALHDLQEQFELHQMRQVAREAVASIRGRIETRSLTCEIIDQAILSLNPS